MKKWLLLLGWLSVSAWADISVQDVLGRTVTVKAVPQRVVLGFYYEDYLAIVGPGAADKLVGLSLATWKDWRPRQYEAYLRALPQLAQVPDVGTSDDGSFSLEKVVALKPDLLILAAWNYEALGANVKKLEDAGVPIVVLDYNSQTVEKHVASTLALGKLMGVEARAQELADNYRRAMDEVMQRVARAPNKSQKVYVELAQKGPEHIGNSYGNNMWGALIEQLGGVNIAAGQVQNWGALSKEYVIAQQPEVIFFAGSEWLNQPQAVALGFGADVATARARIAAYLERVGYASFPAVKNKRVYGIYHGGARTLSDYVYAQYLAKALHPEQFADVNPEENLRAFYQKYLPIAADGLFMYHYE